MKPPRPTSVVRHRLCLECLRDGTVELSENARAHLERVHPDGIATLSDMIAVYESGKVDSRASPQLRQIRDDVIAELLGKLPAHDAERLRILLELVDRFLPEDCGGASTTDAM